MTNRTRSVVITGADSGIGFEAAAQFANTGFGRVVVTARTDIQAQQAVTALSARTGSRVFEAVTLDLDDLASVDAAADSLAAGAPLDVLILNAGMLPRKELVRTAAGVERLAAALTGHHRFTMRLLESDALSSNARIVISSAEAARGDLPILKPLEVERLAAKYFDGNLERVIEAIMRLEAPIRYSPHAQFATTKVFAVWWAAALSRRLPKGMTVNAVAPGNTPMSEGAGKVPFLPRYTLFPLMKMIPGVTQTVAQAAGRYVLAANFGANITGAFFASRPRKVAGPMVHTQMVGSATPRALRSVWNATERLSGRHELSTEAAPSATVTSIPRRVAPTNSVISAAYLQ